MVGVFYYPDLSGARAAIVIRAWMIPKSRQWLLQSRIP
jgi:hypothetical protein